MSVETESETILLHVEFNKGLGNPLCIPFAKDAIDTEKRMIRGYASTEALDREG
ncbi:MAG: hypothetical protein ACE5R6_15145 [Candidatus Heimdallarchaeota archaeon]